MISKDIAFLLGIILFIIITVLFFTLKIEWLGYLFMIGIGAIIYTYIKFYVKKENPDEYDDFNNKREPMD